MTASIYLSFRKLPEDFDLQIIKDKLAEAFAAHFPDLNPTVVIVIY